MKKYDSISYKAVRITDGFWKHRQDINAEVTSRAVYNQFSNSHRFEALDCNWKEGMNYRPHIFWDSDVAKWIEGAAYIIAQTGDTYLEQLCENAIDMIIKNQTEEGYFNSHYLVMDQTERFKIRDNHELYCAGHLIEAACAYYEATGKDRFLKAMCRFADYIYNVFYIYQTASFATSGHQEIELALVRLYDLVGDEKYLTLSRYFLDRRGNNTKDPVSKDAKDASRYLRQDHLPVTMQRTAEGHCVRAMYLYSAMADIAKRYDDEAYLEACQAIYQNVVTKRMYITGGIGSSNLGEAFTTDYFLPNETAYTETCAAIALALFCKRMQQVCADSEFADTIERVLYNGFLSGVSLDGKSFFYSNPLEIDPYFYSVNTSSTTKRYLPIMQRVELFGCSCCPPNVLRFLGSLGELLYTHDEHTLFVHQFMNSEASVRDTSITQTTAYPADGAVTIRIAGDDFKQIAVRIPGWCTGFTTSQPYQLERGYAYFDAAAEIRLVFDMPVQLYEANNAVQNNAGCAAVTRGPIVYCLEGVDNGAHLRSIRISSQASFTPEDTPEYGVPALLCEGLRKKEHDGLYRPYSADREKVPLRFIPYFAFANRGATEMLVWVSVSE